MKKIIKRGGCIIISIILLCCIILVGLYIYWINTDLLGTKSYEKTNLNYIKGRSDFTFKIPEIDLNVTISKRKGAQFFVMFSQKDNITTFSDSIDYIEFVTSGYDLNFIFNPVQKDSIYFWYNGGVSKINQVNYKLCELHDRYDLKRGTNDSIYRFFEKGIKTSPDTLRKPYINLSIAPSTFGIILFHDSGSQEWIKKGDIYGGW